jgi:ubiquinone/menaquinone biosynthesis C-methylase UbiE
VVELLAPRPGERVLDLGCGTGHSTSKIAESGATVVGLDGSDAMEEDLRPLLFREGNWYVDYVRLRFVAVKERVPGD